MENNNEKIQEIIDKLSSTDLKNDDRATLFIKLSNLYNENGNMENAMKYAAMSTISTASPRADACCCIGDCYLEINNQEWAINWYEKAVSNASTTCDKQYYTWLPLMKISQVHLLSFDIFKAQKYLDAAELLTTKENEHIISMKQAIEECKKISFHN